MKILFLARSLNIGGAERQLANLAGGLYALGHEVKIAAFYAGGPLESEISSGGVPVIDLKKRGRWHSIGFLFNLLKTVRLEQPIILHSYLVVPNILSVLIKALFPDVKIIWGVRASNMDLDHYDWLSGLTYRIERKLARFADLIICNSYSGLRHATNHGFPSARMIVIPNGIDTNRFNPDPDSRARIRAEWNIGENDKLIGLAARLDPMKDHETFIKSAAIVSGRRLDAKFVCIGSGSLQYLKKLQSMAHHAGLDKKTIWAGSRTDMPSVFNALDVAVSSSSFGEGFQNVIAEAMACGTPCVVTDVGDAARVVGEVGKIVPPKDPEALAAAIELVLSSSKPDPHFLHKYIENNFSCDILVRKTEKALLECMQAAHYPPGTGADS